MLSRVLLLRCASKERGLDTGVGSATCTILTSLKVSTRERMPHATVTTPAVYESYRQSKC